MTATLLVGVLAATFAPQQTDTTFSVSPGARIEVETFGGEINVKTWDKNAVRVQATHGRRDVVEIRARSGSVQIEAQGRMGPATATTFNLLVPVSASISASGVNTDIAVEGIEGDVDAETVQGGIRVSGGKRLKLESVEGDIVVEKARGNVNASTVNRGIRITNVIGDVAAETVNGPIVMQGVQANHVDASTVNGRIVYEGTIRDGGDYSIASHNGGIWVVVPEKAGVTVSVSTFNGELDSTLPITLSTSGNKRRYNFVFGNGRARLDLESFGGNIYLRRPGETIPTQIEPPRPPKPPKIRIKDNN
jgi:DUF4097 and DUF4098 domain-containing protein YvlB